MVVCFCRPQNAQQTPDSHPNDERLTPNDATNDFMDTKILKPAPLAYENEQFLKSPDGRVLRFLWDCIEPLARFRREQIQDTVVFFGSARFQNQLDAGHRLTEVQGNRAG